MKYLKDFWHWLMTRNLAPGWVVVRQDDYSRLLDRVIADERRSAAQRKSRALLAAEREARLARDPDPFIKEQT